MCLVRYGSLVIRGGGGDSLPSGEHCFVTNSASKRVVRLCGCVVNPFKICIYFESACTSYRSTRLTTSIATDES